jgi:hypothetical protein
VRRAATFGRLALLLLAVLLAALAVAVWMPDVTGLESAAVYPPPRISSTTVRLPPSRPANATEAAASRD